MRVGYQEFPVEERAAFRRLCAQFGLREDDFELEAEVEDRELASWRARPHVVIVHHVPSSRTRICSGWARRTWLDIVADYFRKCRLPVQRALQAQE